MTTPPPPPDPSSWPSSRPSQPQPPGQPQPWPPSQPQPAASHPGRQKWWTGGRIFAAIAIVLVLMGVSAVGGFLAGSTWGTIETFGEGFADGLDVDGGVPGLVPVDSPATEGQVLQSGARVSGVVADRPVEHLLDVASGRVVAVEVIDAEFDTVLVLLDDSGEVVDADDDGGESTLSALELSVPAGTYRVRVQPWGEDDGGSYTLAVD